MPFDKNQTEFKDIIQEKIWELGARQLPLEVSLPFVPDELKPACTDFYNFTRDLLADMYENPIGFGFEIDPSQPGWMNVKQVEFYFWFIGGLSNLSGNRFEMPAGAFDKLVKKFSPKSIAALKEHGFIFEGKGDTVVVRNALYPDMFIGAKATVKAGYANYKVNRDYFRLYCDFRALAGYKRTYEDLHLIFSDGNRRIAEKIHEHCIGRKIMPQKCNYYFRVEYKYKGKIVYIADLVGGNQFKINIGFAPFGSPSYQRCINFIENDSSAPELKEFFIRNAAKKCRNCKVNCEIKKNPKYFFGRKMVVCMNLPFIRMTNPAEEDLNSIYKFIDLRALLIDEKISEPFYPGNG